jgi:hypothetical protein
LFCFVFVFILDRVGRENTDFTQKKNCFSSLGDGYTLPVTAGPSVRLAFVLTGRARMYSFWVAATDAGEARGPVAGGGANMPGNWDV